MHKTLCLFSLRVHRSSSFVSNNSLAAGFPININWMETSSWLRTNSMCAPSVCRACFVVVGASIICIAGRREVNGCQKIWDVPSFHRKLLMSKIKNSSLLPKSTPSKQHHFFDSKFSRVSTLLLQLMRLFVAREMGAKIQNTSNRDRVETTLRWPLGC